MKVKDYYLNFDDERLIQFTVDDFQDLGGEYDEKELELSLIRNIRRFLLEMGRDFSFIGNQYKLDLDGEEFVSIRINRIAIRCSCRLVVILQASDGSFLFSFE